MDTEQRNPLLLVMRLSTSEAVLSSQHKVHAYDRQNIHTFHSGIV